MKKNMTLIYVLSGAVAMALLSCSPTKPQENNNVGFKAPRFLDDTRSYERYTVDTEKGDTIITPDGSTITIPAHAFVFADHTPVKGNVELIFKTYYTPGEILASGIQMQYDSLSPCDVFQSAGMFEIAAAQNGSMLELAPKAELQLDFATDKNDTTYNFYQQDTATGKWTYLGTPQVDSNRVRKKLMQELAAVFTAPVKPILRNKKKPVIDIDVDLQKNPELAGLNGILWQAPGNSESNPDVFNETWESADLRVADAALGHYTLSLKNNNKALDVVVCPVLNEPEYNKALSTFNDRMKSFTASLAEQNEKRKALEETKAFQRSVTLSSLGTYNFDILRAALAAAIAHTLKIFLPQQLKKVKPNNLVLYVGVRSGMIVSSYCGTLSPDVKLLGDGADKIAIVNTATNEAYFMNGASISKKLNNTTDRSLEVTLEPYPAPISSTDDLTLLMTR